MCPRCTARLPKSCRFVTKSIHESLRGFKHVLRRNLNGWRIHFVVVLKMFNLVPEVSRLVSVPSSSSARCSQPSPHQPSDHFCLFWRSNPSLLSTGISCISWSFSLPSHLSSRFASRVWLDFADPQQQDTRATNHRHRALHRPPFCACKQTRYSLRMPS